MTEKSTQAEPTMEEILASIRRIISEDGEQESAQPSEKVVQMPSAKDQPGPSVEEDVLELTDVVSEEEAGDAVDELDVEIEPEVEAEAPVEPEPEVMATPEPEPETEPEPEPEMAREAAPESLEDEISEAVSQKIEENLSEWGDPVDPAEEDEAIMSQEASDKARAAFLDLSDLLVAGYQGADNTLEAMVRKMLKPMLKSWLDENLPDIVERVVAREIARLARSKRP